MTNATSASRQPMNPEDSVFTALDNQRIGLGSQTWVTHVLGVYIRRSEAWVQVELEEDDSSASVILHLHPEATASAATLALWKWAQTPLETRPYVIDPMRRDVH